MAVRVLDKPLPEESRQGPRDLRFYLPCTCGDSEGNCLAWAQFLLGYKNMMRVLIERFNRLINPLMCVSTHWFVESFQLDQQLIYAVD